MTSQVLQTNPIIPETGPAAGTRRRRPMGQSNRVRVDGKFFRLTQRKFHVKGVTYGPFAPVAGHPLPEPAQVARDFAQIRDLGANCVRIYDPPPHWLLDLAGEYDLKVFLDVPWPKNLVFVGNPQVCAQARAAVHDAARACGDHPAVFAISVVNEIPPDIVRFSGRRKVESFIDELAGIVRREAPGCLVTFANFPTTEYLRPRGIDFHCFNVYFHDEQALRNYLARLQSTAGDKPLIIGEHGIDTLREQSEPRQAEMLETHVRAAFEEGLAGTVIFSFTDDWHVHGHAVEDWAFGLTRRDRSPKPAFTAVRELFHRVPQVTDVKLPTASVVVCTFNGGRTLAACLSSLLRLNYADFEVICVDDGSTDDTAQILRQFPQVKCIRQRNMGLSHARNVGAAAARGEIIAYTDSDCEVDEDWLYHLALTLVRSTHVGVGGPNLIPDEGNWIADAVGRSPGGPVHVMIDDRTAEHVPGCNMAFYAWALRRVNGFDPQFRAAGDDVDLIWRLQNEGYTIGFAPAAQVWHYRRNSVKAYLDQQRGYGAAEALLKYKHPDRFNCFGAMHWRGRIYGGAETGVRIGGEAVYHGLFGTGLFQTIYHRPASMAVMVMMCLEWRMLASFIAVLGLAFHPLIVVAAAMFLAPVVLAAVAAAQAQLPRRHWLMRPLIGYLHFRQPIARGWARYRVRLKQNVSGRWTRSDDRPERLPLDPLDRRALCYWNKELDRLNLLERIRQQCDSAGWRIRTDSGWQPWDIEIDAGRFARVRLITATEQHHGTGKLTRVRVTSALTGFARALLGAGVILAALPLLHFGPLGGVAAMVPLSGWAIFTVARRRGRAAVLALIDRSAEAAGFVPLLPSPAGDIPRVAPYPPGAPIRGSAGEERPSLA